MDMLYQDQDADRNAAQQGDDLVTSFIKAIEKQKLRSGMTGVEQVFGDEIFTIKWIAQGVSQWYQVGRRIERHQGDGDKPAAQKQTKSAKEQNSQVGIFESFDQHPKTGSPKDGENTDRNIFGRKRLQNRIIGNKAFPCLNDLEKIGKRH